MALAADKLTPREREVLALMAAGKTNGEISTALGISFPTAKAHVSSILAKLGAESRDDAVARWRDRAETRSWTRFALAPMFALGVAAVGAVVAVVAIRTLIIADGGRPDEMRFPLDGLEVGIPRHEEVPGLGSSPYGMSYGLWLVRYENGTVRAFFDRDPHGLHGAMEPRLRSRASSR